MCLKQRSLNPVGLVGLDGFEHNNRTLMWSKTTKLRSLRGCGLSVIPFEARNCSFAVRTQPIQQLEWRQIWIKGLLPSCVAVSVTTWQSDRSPYLPFVHSQFHNFHCFCLWCYGQVLKVLLDPGVRGWQTRNHVKKDSFNEQEIRTKLTTGRDQTAGNSKTLMRN